MSYCTFAKNNPLHTAYHDTEYGFPVSDDNVLFERLVLEMNQAGLSWGTILKKREGFANAFENFDVQTVARFGARDIERLLEDARIVRNRLKINAAINNARVIQEIQKTYGSFMCWITKQSFADKVEKDQVKIFKKQGFTFVGKEILKEFLQSIGELPSPHDAVCPVAKAIFKAKILAVVARIPKGETLTYGEVAKAAGNPAAARAVGAVMRQNADTKISCHRVVSRRGLGGYNGLQGDKAELLRREKQPM